MEFVGTTIGRYKILRLIGEGGMASVYEGEHESLGSKAAIKVLNPILSANQQIRVRFKNEAKLMAAMDHPNITRVIDYEESESYLAITMEMLAGEDMSEYIKSKGKLSEDRIKDIFQQVLSAFSYAHDKGIVHRDVKPSNIFLLPNGQVKILDFGIAKLFGQGNEMTQTGTQMGTPIYMSPEQVKADKSIDHRSDIYSLGVTMYFALNGKPPYDSDTSSQFDIFNKIVYEAIPLSTLTGDLVPSIEKACQKDRENRYQSCEEWQKAIILNINSTSSEKTILDINTSEPNTKTPPPPSIEKKTNNKRVWGIAGTVIVMMISIIIKTTFSGGTSSEASPEASSYEVAPEAAAPEAAAPEAAAPTEVYASAPSPYARAAEVIASEQLVTAAASTEARAATARLPKSKFW